MTAVLVMDSWYSFCYAPVLYHDNKPDNRSYDEEFILWEDGDFGLCFEQVVIGIFSFTLLSLMSGFYSGIHCRFTRRKVPSLSPCLKGLVTFILLINSLVQLTASFWLVHQQPYAVVLSGSVEVLCWFVHLVCLIVLARSVLHIGYGPLPLNLMWGLSLLFSILRFRSGIEYIRHPYHYEGREPNPLGYLTLSLQINSYVRFGAQVFYLLLLIVPAKRETGARLFFSVEQSSTQNADDKTPLLLGRKKGEEIVSSEDINYGTIQPARIRLTSEDNANPFSLLSFWWLTSLMQRGANGFLQSPADLPLLPRSLSTSKIRTKFQNVLRRDQYIRHDTANGVSSECTLHSLDRLSQYSSQQSISVNATTINEAEEDEPYYTLSSSNDEESQVPETPSSTVHFSIIRSLNRAFGLHFYPLGLMKLASDCLGFAGPLLLHQLVGFMENRKVSLQ